MNNNCFKKIISVILCLILCTGTFLCFTGCDDNNNGNENTELTIPQLIWPTEEPEAILARGVTAEDIIGQLNYMCANYARNEYDKNKFGSWEEFFGEGGSISIRTKEQLSTEDRYFYTGKLDLVHNYTVKNQQLYPNMNEYRDVTYYYDHYELNLYYTKYNYLEISSGPILQYSYNDFKIDLFLDDIKNYCNETGVEIDATDSSVPFPEITLGSINEMDSVQLTALYKLFVATEEKLMADIPQPVLNSSFEELPES